MTHAEQRFLIALVSTYGYEAVLTAMLRPPFVYPEPAPKAKPGPKPKVKTTPKVNPTALKLTTPVLHKIKALREKGVPYPEIANQLRMSVSTAYTGAKRAQELSSNNALH